LKKTDRMTSQTRQDAISGSGAVGAGIMKGKHQGYGATTTSRHVHFGANEKGDRRSNKLLHWDDLRMAP
jgi:hypothetical protein